MAHRGNVLLLYPKIWPEGEQHYGWQGLPLSTLSLASCLDADGVEARMYDARIQSDYLEGVLSSIDGDTVCLGISAMTCYQIVDGLDVARAVRREYPELPIVWGGWHPSLLPDQTIADDDVDIVVRGEGELTFREIVNALRSGASVAGLPGTTVMADGGIHHGPDRGLAEMEELPPINYDLVDMSPYIYPEYDCERNIDYESSRGCPWRCGFCSIHVVTNRRWSSLSSGRVVQDFRDLKSRFDVDGVYFVDSNYFVNPHRVRDVSTAMAREGLEIKWAASGRADQLTRLTVEDWQLIKESGCFRILVGAESASQDVLDYIQKDILAEKTFEFVERCREFDIIPICSWIVGFPDDPERDFDVTIDAIYRVLDIFPKAENYLFSYTPYPASPLYARALKRGFEEPRKLEEWGEHTLSNVTNPWVDDKLRRKIERYMLLFGDRRSEEMMHVLQEVGA